MEVWMVDHPDYSIVIPCYNEERLLPATLEAVRAAMAAVTSHVGEIVVTDNASTDASADIARDAGARVVFEEHRQISRSRNVGGAHARGRMLVFVDADTLISPRLLRTTLEALESGRVVGGGARLHFDHYPYRLARMGTTLWNILARRMRWACGAYIFCRRDAFLDVHGFPEQVYAGEELFLSDALRRWGRSRGQEFVLLDEPIVSSARKFEWYGPTEYARAFLVLALPRALRRRNDCSLWYERPEVKPEPDCIRVHAPVSASQPRE